MVLSNKNSIFKLFFDFLCPGQMGPYRGNRVQVATGACLTLAPLRGALGGQGQAGFLMPGSDGAI